MEFHVAHRFRAPLARVAAALLDPGFQAALADVAGLRARTVLSQEERSDGKVVRRVRCVPSMTIPPTARKMLGDGEPSWVEEATWDPTLARWDWVIHPDVGRELLVADGTTTLVERGEEVERSVTGRVSVRVPFYGRKVERGIVQGIERAYRDEARKLRSWLKRKEA